MKRDSRMDRRTARGRLGGAPAVACRRPTLREAPAGEARRPRTDRAASATGPGTQDRKIPTVSVPGFGNPGGSTGVGINGCAQPGSDCPCPDDDIRDPKQLRDAAESGAAAILKDARPRPTWTLPERTIENEHAAQCDPMGRLAAAAEARRQAKTATNDALPARKLSSGAEPDRKKRLTRRHFGSTVPASGPPGTGAMRLAAGPSPAPAHRSRSRAKKGVAVPPRGTCRILASALVILLVLLLAGLASPPRAAVVGSDLLEGDPAAASIAARLEAESRGAPVELLAKRRHADPVTGYVYTVLKARVGERDVSAVLNEATGTFALDAGLPARESRELLARLPSVYRKLDPELITIVRRAQGGTLGGGIVREGEIEVVFHADSSEDLDRIAPELGGIAAERFDAEVLWKESPPIVHPDREGTLATPAPAPKFFTLSAPVSVADLLRIGSLEPVRRIERKLVMTPRLDASVPRIRGDVTRGYGLDGFNADIGIVDSGIDNTHPNLPYVIAEMDFTGATRVCDGGPRSLLDPPGNACQSNCAGGVCSARTWQCVGGGSAGLECCPGGVCENNVGDTDGHGTHVAGIAGNNSAGFRGMAHFADLINAKAIPGTNAPAALAWARGQGADVINGSYGTNSRGCRGLCTAPPPRIGVGCFTDAWCDTAPGNGVCGAPRGNPCIVDADCNLPAGTPNGLCTAPVPDGQSGGTRAVDFEAFTSNVTIVIAAEERPYNGRCSNASGTACWGDAACPAGGRCLAFPSTPNDNFNGITVGSTNVTAGASTVSWFSQRGPAVGDRSKPDVVAPGEAPTAGRCIGGASNGNPCNDVLGDADCPGGNCSAQRCVGLCTAPPHLVGLFCTANAECDSAVGTGDGACGLPANAGTACSDSRTHAECPGGACWYFNDPDGIDSCAADHEGTVFGRCSAPAPMRPFDCFVNSDCDNPGGTGNGVCGTIPGEPAPGTAKPDFTDKEGTSMAAPHVSGLTAQLWDFGDREGILKDTPYLKATILNTARRLAGWTRPSVTQPLDIAQGTGEVDALEAFHAYADDLRVWQQRVTGTASRDSHWYWTDLTAGATQAVTLVFERHESNTAGAFTPLNDLDLRLYDPAGTTIVESSLSSVDSVEHIVYTPTQTGRHCIEVDPFDLSQGGAELYAVAGTFERLNFLGTVFPCIPDFGDAPDPFTAPGFYPTRLASNGARHLDWTKEWLGTSRPEIDGELEKPTLAVRSRVDPFPSVSGERDAIDPADQDGMPNLVDRDAWDDGVVIPGPFLPGVPKTIFVTVQTTVDDTGVGPTGRYEATVPAKRLYLNGWADWNGDGDWGGGGEKIIGIGSPTGQFPVDPETFGANGRFTIGESFTDSNGSGRWEPGELFVDTVGKTERTYAIVVTPPLVIAPIFYLRFRVDYGEDVGHVANVSGNLAEYRGAAQFGEVEDYVNRYEIDVFPESVAIVDVRVPADSLVPRLIELTGPTTVRVDLASIADPDGNGREQVQAEMVQLELTGTDPALGTILVRRRDPSLHPFQASTGEIEESVNGTASTLDIAPFVTSPPDLCADSHFDIYLEVSLPDLGIVTHAHRPKRMRGMIYHKPPREGDTYSSPDYIGLFDSSERLVAAIGPGSHTPVPPARPREVDVFPASRAEMDLRFPTGGPPNIVRLEGPTTVVVDLGSLADTNGNGREQVTTEMTHVKLEGFDSNLGRVIVRNRSSSLHPFQRSTGEIEEDANPTARVLDLPPFTTVPAGLTASSFFNVFLEVELPDLGGIKLHNHMPKEMLSTIRHKPPAEGDIYQSPIFIQLYDDSENHVADIGPGWHIPHPEGARGACCLGGSRCSTLSAGHCRGLEGVYLGDGSSCTGACAAPIGPPGVTNSLRVQKTDPLGRVLLVSWNGTACPATDYALLFGNGSQLPGSLAGVYTPSGAVCSTGGAPTLSWNSPDPSPSDPKRMIWFLAVAHDGASEGSWGRNSGPLERTGPGPNGSSGLCSGGKNLTNTCGQSSCSQNGSACSSPGQCCTGVCAGGVCCGPDGSPCASGAECCEGTCVAGACQTPCRSIGEPCALSAECCSGNCAGGACRAACAPDGQPCTAPADCCSTFCLDGLCRPPCTTAGGFCETPGECCSGTCVAGQCCRLDGAACASSGDCCGRSCVAGACQSDCFPDGQACSASSQCCSGSCVAGTCQAGCLADGQSCAFAAQCCSGSCSDGVCDPCGPNPSGCTSDEQCCGGRCEDGRCCALVDQSCRVDADCCSQVCDRGACAPTRACLPGGSACGSSSECCSGSCLGGVCQPPCFDDGQSCASPSQCCSGNCRAGVCQPPGCVPDGQACGSPSQCCSGNCQGGFCQPPSCFPNGQPCGSPSQCCSGNCQGGFCQPLSCVPNGQSCSSPAQCCSGNCQGGFCQPPPGCFPNGQLCSSSTQCCSGVCSGGVCTPCRMPGEPCASPSQCCSGVCGMGTCH